ncbi:MAG: hypothetical protein U9N06_03230 [candidate division WOR-3 bacterium]|nr:hypothetical protein [candidate division WOR-3 bacterium]
MLLLYILILMFSFLHPVDAAKMHSKVIHNSTHTHILGGGPNDGGGGVDKIPGGSS